MRTEHHRVPDAIAFRQGRRYGMGIDRDMGRRLPEFDEGDRSRIIEMAWEDRTPFEAIEAGYGLDESEVIRFMRRHMTSGSFRLWRRRVTSRATKHLARRPADVSRAHCPTQYKPRSR